jgi:hypothetical protein
VRRALILALFLSVVAAPLALAATFKVIGTSPVAKSMFQGAIATGSVKKPVALEMKATATPRISSSGSYIVTCRKGSKKADARSQQPFVVNTPFTKRLPIPIAGADRCDITANVQQNHDGGKLVVKILAR